MSKKKVVVVGAGPGGLTAAMILATKGYDVTVYEKHGVVGGRNSSFELEGGFKFDLGPTFLMMMDILEDVFRHAGRDVYDYLDIRTIDPFYRLVFGDGRTFLPTADKTAMKEQMDRLFPGNYEGYLRYLDYEARKYARIAPCLQVPYDKLTAYAHPRFLKAIPYLDAHLDLHKHLGRFFNEEELKLSFTFQAKYLGMSPWSCPATFSIISYVEHSGGIHHPIGGLNEIPKAMAKVLAEEGGRIEFNAPVKQVMVENGQAVGVLLESGEEIRADYVVVNADFGHAVERLFPRPALKRWTPEALERKGISCSTFMLYLGVDKVYDQVPHHNILFASDYKRNVTEIADTLVLSQEPSVYVQNASVTDPTLAPEGKSTIYLLVPVANQRSRVDWDTAAASYRERVLDIVEARGGLTDLRKHIVAERMMTPKDWEQSMGVYRGAVFNLAHTIDQMLYFRPHNEFEEVGSCYLTGGGTHPGSGLPTIFESGIISAGQILKKDAWYL